MTSHLNPSRPALSRGRRLVIGGLLVSMVALLAYIIAGISAMSGQTRPVNSSSSFLPMARPGIRRPPVVSADEARLDGDDEIIGVVIAGQARAYRIDSFDPEPGGRHEFHVVNDLIGATPVTVTHCVRTNCTRVYTAESSSEPLEIGVGGWGGRFGPGLLLMIGSVRYHQETGQPLTAAAAFPYARCEFVVTTWRQWLASHPDTDLYQGIDHL